MAGVKPSAISSATVAAFKTKLGYLTQEEADLRYPQISEGEPVDLDALLAAKADLASPTFTGTPLVPTAAAGTNTTQVANTAFVNKNTGIIQFQDNSTKTNTGDTNENTVGTYTIKGGSLGANGSIEILFFAMIGTSTQGSTFRVYFNGTLVGTAALSTNTHSPLGLYVWNKNSTTSQESATNSGIAGLLWASNSNALNTYSINTANDITVTFTIQAANSAYVGYLRRIKCTTYYSN